MTNHTYDVELYEAAKAAHAGANLLTLIRNTPKGTPLDYSALTTPKPREQRNGDIIVSSVKIGQTPPKGMSHRKSANVRLHSVSGAKGRPAQARPVTMPKVQDVRPVGHVHDTRTVTVRRVEPVLPQADPNVRLAEIHTARPQMVQSSGLTYSQRASGSRNWTSGTISATPSESAQTARTHTELVDLGIMDKCHISLTRGVRPCASCASRPS